MDQMEKRIKNDLNLHCFKMLDVLFVTLPIVGVWFLYYVKQQTLLPNPSTQVLLVFSFMLLYFVFGRTYEAFLLSYRRISEMIYSQCLALLMSDTFMFIFLWEVSDSFPNILPALGALAVQMMLAVVWCFWGHHWYFAHFRPKQCAIVYDMREGLEQLFIDSGMDKKFDVKKIIPAGQCVKSPQCLVGVDTVFLSGVHSAQRNIIVKYCVEQRITCFVIPRVGDMIMAGAREMNLLHLPMLRVERSHPPVERVIVKRAIDIVLSGILLIIASPVILVTAVAVRSDGGPAFYRQVRLTRNGKKFKLIKFRSMRVDAEKDGVARLSSGKDDDRVTRVGKVLRACRLDELPQLFNVFIGDMSLVGPRPERPEIAARYEAVLPEFRLRLQVKAGLTGYAQVYGKYNTEPYDKLLLDLMYIANANTLMDLRILFATVKILFMKESTEGIGTGEITAMREQEPIETDGDTARPKDQDREDGKNGMDRPERSERRPGRNVV